MGLEISVITQSRSRIEATLSKERASRAAENSANERKAALESEVLRLSELESRRGQAADAAVELRESNSRLSAELAAEQENFSALRSRFEETETS